MISHVLLVSHRKDDKDDGTQESVKLPDHFAGNSVVCVREREFLISVFICCVCLCFLFKAKRSFLMNMTSGSLEAFGGEASRADLYVLGCVWVGVDVLVRG